MPLTRDFNGTETAASKKRRPSPARTDYLLTVTDLAHDLNDQTARLTPHDIKRLACMSSEDSGLPRSLLNWALKQHKIGDAFIVVPAAAPGVPRPPTRFHLFALEPLHI